MSARELLDKISETLLWENISAQIEKTERLPELLNEIGYLDSKDEIIKKADKARILESEPPEFSNIQVEGGRLTFGFTMPFVMIVTSGKEELLRITATAAGNFSIPDENAFDWGAFDWGDMTRPELLSRGELVSFSRLSFTDAECDELNA